MPINFPNSPSISQLYTYNDKTWEWNGTYWEVYSALTSYITSAYTVGNGYSDISGVTNGNIALKGFSGINISIIDSSDTLTFSGSPEFTGNTSASCITDLYVTNVYGCSPITIHDSVQSVGSSSTGITSFSFGNGVSAFGDYSHAEGDTTTSLGTGSHAEGYNTHTGLYGYNSTSIVSGVITLDSSYGDVTTQFSIFIILDDYNFDIAYGTTVFYINSITFDGTNTIITLTDASVNTTQAHIGSDLYITPTSSDVYVGGYNSHSEGENNVSIGYASHTEGIQNFSYGSYSHSEGVQTKSFGGGSHSEGRNTTSNGQYSHVEGVNTITEGTYSHAEGEGCNSIGASSHAEGYSTQSIADYSHSEGYDSSTGQRGYYSSSIVSGVITLDASYGDVSSQFISDVVLDDFLYDNIYSVKVFSFSSVIFDGTNTIITLNDLSVSTTQARIGVMGVISPGSGSISVGGYYSHAEGRQTISLGAYSHAQGLQNVSIGQSSFSSGRESYSYGQYSFIHSINSQVYGNRSVVLGGQNITGTTDDTVYVPNLDVKDNLVVSGNSTLQSFSATSGFISGSAQNILTVVGSGDSTSSPIFSVSGATGELLGIYDSLTGSLLSVSDSSNNSIFEVNSDSTILMGNYQALSLNSTTKVSVPSGSTTNIYSIPTSAYTGAFFEYTVSGNTNYRAGNITSVWDGSSAQYIDSYTGGSSPEIGSTSDITFSVSVSGGDAILSASASTNNWLVKTIIRSI